MNVIKQRQLERKEKIGFIKEQLVKVAEAGKEVNDKMLIAIFCQEWGMSKRTVKEYLEIARATKL